MSTTPATLATQARDARSLGDAASVAYADLLDLLDLRVEFFPYAPFTARAWELRDNVTCYDAWYSALAESLRSKVATLDLRRGAGDQNPVAASRRRPQ